MSDRCPFCEIIRGDAPAEKVFEYSDALIIVPLGPVTAGHVLVIPKRHVRDAAEDPMVTAGVMAVTATYVRANCESANIITSIGGPATQTVFHLHVHVVPRHAHDGLALPWTPQQAAGGGAS